MDIRARGVAYQAMTSDEQTATWKAMTQAQQTVMQQSLDDRAREKERLKRLKRKRLNDKELVQPKSMLVGKEVVVKFTAADGGDCTGTVMSHVKANAFRIRWAGDLAVDEDLYTLERENQGRSVEDEGWELK